MPDVKATLERITKVLADERRDCLWDGEQFRTSSYAYVSKEGLHKVHLLLAQAISECAYFAQQEEEHAATKRKLASCAEELDLIGEDNDTLRKSGKETLALLLMKETRIEQLFRALSSLRKVFGGTARTHNEMAELLRNVDEALGGMSNDKASGSTGG